VARRLHLLRRGCRAGRKYAPPPTDGQTRTSAIISHGQAREIPTIIGYRVLVDSDQTFGYRTFVLRPLHRCSSAGNQRVTSFNARSVRHKSAAIQQWIRYRKPVAALVETWHEDAHSPDLIACVPPGFTLIERVRPRNDELLLTYCLQTTAESTCSAMLRCTLRKSCCQSFRLSTLLVLTLIALASVLCSSSSSTI
jgi:hypothetical protein